MVNVTIKGIYNCRWGKTLCVYADGIVHIGDEVLGNDNVVYKVKSVIMPTRPIDDDRFAIVVEE